MQKCAAFFVSCWNLEWCAYNLNSKPLIILKQVQGGNGSLIQPTDSNYRAFSRDSRVIRIAARCA
ncbi:hypothetical protein GCM10022269_06040 [Sphingorhabdus rigui]